MTGCVGIRVIDVAPQSAELQDSYPPRLGDGFLWHGAVVPAWLPDLLRSPQVGRRTAGSQPPQLTSRDRALPEEEPWQ